MEKILVVDDEKSLREVMSIMLKRAGYEVTEASDGEQAIGQVNKDIYDLVITDLRMPKADGMDVLKAVKSSSPETVVLVVTAFGTADSAVEAMKQGAYDYLTKPFQVDEVQLIIRNALEKRRLSTENMLLKREIASQSSFAQIVGQSEAMQKVFDVVRKVADSKSNVLICGESGTGKELVARAIHYNSARSPMSFVAVNCSAVPETLLESELFGHMKGSFTGAVANKAGLFEIANGGTIFLDEIGDTTPAIQVKLLRVIQEREFRRVGGTQDMKVDVRVIAATNRDLEKAVADGSFREDLYYRLDVIPIRLPPLRLRAGDIPLLVAHFLEKFAQESGKDGSDPDPGSHARPPGARMARQCAGTRESDRTGRRLFNGQHGHRHRHPRVVASRGHSSAVARDPDRSPRRRTRPGRPHQRHREGFPHESVGTLEMGEEESSPSAQTQYEIIPLSVGEVCYKRRP